MRRDLKDDSAKPQVLKQGAPALRAFIDTSSVVFSREHALRKSQQSPALRSETGLAHKFNNITGSLTMKCFKSKTQIKSLMHSFRGILFVHLCCYYEKMIHFMICSLPDDYFTLTIDGSAAIQGKQVIN